MQVLVVDNYDSFVFNLVQYLGQLGVDAQVWRNDDAHLGTDADVARAAESFDGVLL
ncbi:anthranilate synthase component II, partial [Mycolicibacterium elephantis]